MASTERFGFNIVEEEDFSREPKPLVDWQRNITDNFKNIDENCAKESDLEKLSKTTSVTTANTDLDNYIENGFYFFSEAFTPSHKPDGVARTDGYLEVLDVDNNAATQRWTVYRTNDIYIRQKAANTWGTWNKLQLADKRGGIELLYANEIQIGETVTLSESLRNFRFVVFRIANSRNYVSCPITNYNGFRGINSFANIGIGGVFEFFAVRGQISGTSIVIDDSGALELQSNGTISQIPKLVSEVWGIR